MKVHGNYMVMFKHPNASKRGTKIEVFRGVCENFASAGLCAFTNDENEMLLVDYEDIVQMKPIK